MPRQGTEALFRQAMSLYQQGRLAAAEKSARSLAHRQPDHAGVQHLLGLIAAQQGDNTQAEKYLARATRLDNRYAEAFFNHGLLLKLLGRPEEALVAFERATRLLPSSAEPRVQLANLLRCLGRLEKALATCDQALRIDNQHEGALAERPIILWELGRKEDALLACKQALDLNPANATMQYNHGNMLRECGYGKKALSAYSKATQLRPDYTEAHYNRASLLKEMGMLEDALTSYRLAIESSPALAKAYIDLGNTLCDLGRFREALQAYEEASSVDPDNPIAIRNQGNLFMDTGQVDKAEACFRRALELKEDYIKARNNLVMLLAATTRGSPDTLLEEQRRWDNIHGAAGRTNRLPARAVAPLSGRRLRVGYVSPDMRTHAVAYFFEPLLEQHDRETCEIFCYSCHPPAQSDATTERLRKASEHWRQVHELDDESLAQRIYDDRIDILVDLAGYTMGNRLAAFTYRPAPVQVSYLGFFAATGLESMDYWLTDRILHPPGTTERTLETIYRLPRCWVCYRPPEQAPPVAPRPADGGHIMFGCFSNISKFSDQAIAVWSDILRSLPESRLLLMERLLASPEVRAMLLARFEQQGIGCDRLILRGSVPYIQYLATYAEIDIILDPFPRTGGTTTAEALWMGVPVITLAGQRYVERISTSKLHALGLDDLVASNHKEYTQKAIALARDHGHRQLLRKTLRQRMAASPLCDSKGLARSIEAAFTEMWSQWNDGD